MGEGFGVIQLSPTPKEKGVGEGFGVIQLSPTPKEKGVGEGFGVTQLPLHEMKRGWVKVSA